MNHHPAPAPSRRRLRCEDTAVLIEMNTTPLIDVLLVLLVMLIITIPVQLHAIKLDLPVATAPQTPPPPAVQLDIDAQGQLRWQGVVLSTAQLQIELTRLGQMAPQPALHIRPHADSPYSVFAHVLASARRQGLRQVAVLGSEQFHPRTDRP